MQNVKLNEVLHQSTRTKMVTYLIAFGETDYTTLKKTMGLSDGQMTTHMRVLLSGNYVTANKFFENNKPKTVYTITKEGKKRFEDYLDDLRKIIGHIGEPVL